MTIPVNNLNFQNIIDEFGSPTVKSLSAYYAGGGFVPNPAPTSASQIGIIPVSGPISFGNFRGVTKFTPITITPPAQTDMYGHTNGPFAYQASGTYNATNIHFIFCILENSDIILNPFLGFLDQEQEIMVNCDLSISYFLFSMLKTL